MRTQEQQLNNQWFSKIAVWMVIAMVLFTVFKQFDGRSHFLCAEKGWEEVAGYCIDWAAQVGA